MGLGTLAHGSRMRKRQSSTAVKTRLLDFGVQVLRDRGYHGAGLKEILDLAQIPKGSFYHYFKSKDHFGAAVIQHYTDKVIDECDLWMATPGVGGLTALTKYLVSFMERERSNGFAEGCLLGTLGAEIGGNGEVCLQALKIAMRRVQERFSEALQRGQKEGTVRTDLQASSMAALLLSAWEGAIMRMKVERSTDPLEEIFEHLVNRYFSKDITAGRREKAV